MRQQTLIVMPPGWSSEELSSAEVDNLATALSFMSARKPLADGDALRLTTDDYVMQRVGLSNTYAIQQERNPRLDLLADYRYEAIAERRHVIGDILVRGDRIWIKTTLHGRHQAPMFGIAASGAAIEADEMIMLEFRDGKIASSWMMLDELQVARQIGASITLPGA